MTEQIIPQEQIDKSENRKNNKTPKSTTLKTIKYSSPQSKILKKVEFQK